MQLLNLVHTRKLLVGVLTITALILTLGGFTKNFTVANEIDDRSTIWTEIKKILTFLMGKCKVDPAINGVMLNEKNPVGLKVVYFSSISEQ